MKTLFIWLFMVAVLSLMPVSKDTPDVPFADKGIHFMLYAITAALIYNVLVTESKAGLRSALIMLGRRKIMWLSVALAAAYGLFMEGAQGAFTATRTFSWADAAANLLGATAWAIYHIKVGRNARHKNI